MDEAPLPPPAWGWAAPVAAAGAAGVCLVLGARMGMRRAMTVTAAAPTGKGKPIMPVTLEEAGIAGSTVVDASGMTASQLAGRAFLYGSAWAFGGSAAVVLAAAYAWDVHSVCT